MTWETIVTSASFKYIENIIIPKQKNSSKTGSFQKVPKTEFSEKW